MQGLLVLGLALTPYTAATGQGGGAWSAPRVVSDSTPHGVTQPGTRAIIRDSVLTPCPDTIRHVARHRVRPRPKLHPAPAVQQVHRAPRPRVQPPRIQRPHVLAHVKKPRAQQHPKKAPACERIEIQEKLCSKPGELTVSVLPDKMTAPGPHPTIEPVLAPDVFTFTPPSPGFPTVHADRLFRPQVLGLALVPAIFWLAMHEGGDDHGVQLRPPEPPVGPPTTVPEPGTPLLIGTGIAALLLIARRRMGEQSPVDQSLLS